MFTVCNKMLLVLMNELLFADKVFFSLSSFDVIGKVTELLASDSGEGRLQLGCTPQSLPFCLYLGIRRRQDGAGQSFRNK